MKTENVQRLRRIEATLRAYNRPSSSYLADDIREIISSENEVYQGLSQLEVDYIKAGNHILAIKEHRSRCMREGKPYSLSASKDAIYAAGASIGFYDPNTGVWKKL